LKYLPPQFSTVVTAARPEIQMRWGRRSRERVATRMVLPNESEGREDVGSAFAVFGCEVRWKVHPMSTGHTRPSGSQATCGNGMRLAPSAKERWKHAAQPQIFQPTFFRKQEASRSLPASCICNFLLGFRREMAKELCRFCKSLSSRRHRYSCQYTHCRLGRRRWRHSRAGKRRPRNGSRRPRTLQLVTLR